MEEKEDNIIKVKANQPSRNYINRAATLLLRDQIEGNKEQVYDTVIFKASGKAIQTALISSDCIRRKIPGLYQINRIETVIVKGTRYDDQGLHEEFDKDLVIFEIILTRTPTEYQKKQPGFIGTLPKEEQGDRTYTLDDILGRNRKQVRNYEEGKKYHKHYDQNQPSYQHRKEREFKTYHDDRNEHSERNNRRHNLRENQGNSRRRFNDTRKGSQ